MLALHPRHHDVALQRRALSKVRVTNNPQGARGVPGGSPFPPTLVSPTHDVNLHQEENTPSKAVYRQGKDGKT